LVVVYILIQQDVCRESRDRPTGGTKQYECKLVCHADAGSGLAHSNLFAPH